MQQENAQYRKMTETPVSKLIIMLGIPTTISMLVTNIYNMADTYFVGRLGTSASGAIGVVFGLMAIIQAFGFMFTTISMLVTNIYNMADTYFVGRLGTSASGAIGVVFGLMAIIQAFGFMFGHGAGSIISRRLGARDVESASRFASTSFFASLAAGGAITLFGFLFLEPLVRLLGSTDTILPYAKTYAGFILAAAPFMASSCVLNNILRYEGRAAIAMVGLTTGSVLNIFGDWLLMEKMGFGVEGAGIATALSQTLSFFLLLFMFSLNGKNGIWGRGSRNCDGFIPDAQLLSFAFYVFWRKNTEPYFVSLCHEKYFRACTDL